MKRGPAKKPTVLRMRDNVQIKRVPSTEVTPLLKLPTCPKDLSPDAKKIWRRMGKKLLKLGLITEIDEASFGMWCSTYAELQTLNIQYNKEGLMITYPTTGRKVVNPLLAVIRNTRTQLDRLGAKFGMNPSDRSGISVGTRDEANPYRAWQQGRVTNGGKKKAQRTNTAK